MCEIETQNADQGSSIADFMRMDLERMIEQRWATITDLPELLNAKIMRPDSTCGRDRTVWEGQ
jgi:hypothetical protein